MRALVHVLFLSNHDDPLKAPVRDLPYRRIVLLIRALSRQDQNPIPRGESRVMYASPARSLGRTLSGRPHPSRDS